MRPIGLVLFLAAGPLFAAAPPSPRFDALGDPLPARAIARLGTSRFRLEVARQTVALAPDGRSFAVLGPDREQVLLIDTFSGRVLHRLVAAAGEGIAFLADGKELVCTEAGTLT